MSQKTKRWLRVFAVAALMIVLPVAVFYPFAGSIVDTVRDFGTMSPAGAFFATIAVLLLDGVMAIPHGLVGALAAAALSWPLAFAATWLGLMAASCVSYALGRFAGRPLARRAVGKDDLEIAEQRADGVSAWLLFATRPVPVLGEVLLVAAGIARYPFRRFVLAVGGANTILSIGYTGIGQYFGALDTGNIALIAGVGVPLLGAIGYGMAVLLMRTGKP
ncbi:VTT domain-containing protein [Qipengyuania zhejiangensis]|uniref:VTT domain-containing protein n=1 Tax=Qipengyuania zhejiangensis TaxID=3077782 RepID=UPI002D765CFA|nr:VTT domain-containing protein [Qipengyuania sp. Z2]